MSDCVYYPVIGPEDFERLAKAYEDAAGDLRKVLPRTFEEAKSNEEMAKGMCESAQRYRARAEILRGEKLLNDQ